LGVGAAVWGLRWIKHFFIKRVYGRAGASGIPYKPLPTKPLLKAAKPPSLLKEMRKLKL
jgi:hypothetical protein